MKQRLAIFDFDGTLYDTVPANFAAYQEALARQGVALEQDYFAAYCNGRYYRDFLADLLPAGAPPEVFEQVHRDKIAAYPRYYDRIVENAALFDILEALSATYHIALVSTANRSSVLDVLTKFGRLSAFELVLAQQDVPKKKPAPDGFLLAMAHFGIPPERAIVFEDSPEGLQAAAAAKISCLRVDAILGRA